MPSDAWSLHSQLKKDTIDIGDLPLCKVLVIKDAHYPWLLLVPRREGAVEIIDLDEVAQAQLMTEISRVSRALKEITKCDKLNVAALGQPGAAAACPRHRAAHQRRGLAASGLGRDAAAGA